MRIFLDANVLFSAAKAAGAVHRLLELLHEGGHELWVDAFVVEEARRNLDLKTPSGVAALDAIVERLKLAPVGAEEPQFGATLPVAEKDRPVLAAAIRKGCDVLLTGDRKHFGPLYGRTLHGVTIHSPRSLAEALLG